MSLPLNSDILAAVYESLRACPPFLRWRLPPCEDINFLVTAHRDREGHYTRHVGTEDHFLCVSRARIGHYHSLAVVMAHEMIHLLQAVKKTETRGEHNADFRRRAALAARRAAAGGAPRRYAAGARRQDCRGVRVI